MKKFIILVLIAAIAIPALFAVPAQQTAYAVTRSELVELFIALDIIPSENADEAREVVSSGSFGTLSELVEYYIALDIIPAHKEDEARAVLQNQNPQTELKFSTAQSSPDSSTILVSDSAVTKDVTVMVFDVEAKESDVYLYEVPVQITVSEELPTTIPQFTDVIRDARLEISGVSYEAKSSVSQYTLGDSSSNVVTFSFGPDGVYIPANSHITAKLIVDFMPLEGNYEQWVYVEADVPHNQVEQVIAYDNKNTLITIPFLEGSVNGEEHTLFSKGIFAEVVSVSEQTIQSNTASDVGEFTIKFDVSAFLGDMYVSEDGLIYHIEKMNSPIPNAVSEYQVKSTADLENGLYLIQDGYTETFTLNVTYTPETTDFYRVALDQIMYTVKNENIVKVHTVTPQSDFETNALHLSSAPTGTTVPPTHVSTQVTGAMLKGQPVVIGSNIQESNGGLPFLIYYEIRDETDGSLVHYDFVLDTENSYAIEWTPASAGNYRVDVGLFSPNWNTTYQWAFGAATFTIDAATPTPPLPPSVSPIHISTTPLQTIHEVNEVFEVTTTIEGGNESYLVYYEIYDASDDSLIAYDVYQSALTNSGDDTVFTFVPWTPTQTGSYYISVALFSLDWTENFEWARHAHEFEVTPTGGVSQPPLPSLTSSVAVVQDSTQGQSVDMSFQIENNGGDESFLADIEIYNAADDSFVTSIVRDNLSALKGDTITIPGTWMPQDTGVYYVSVGLFSNDWSHLYEWNHAVSTVTITVSDEVVPKIDPMENIPATVSVGDDTDLEFSISNIGMSGTTHVYVMVYDENENTVFDQWFTDVSLDSNTNTAFNATWTPTESGTYFIDIGVFSEDWSFMHEWKWHAAEYTIL